ncbi:MAG: BamA/TamA family outer membrane protein [Bacteroidota bacterium]
MVARHGFSLLVAALVLGLGSPVDIAAAQYFVFGKNRIQYEAQDWKYIQSDHFDIYYYDPGGQYLADFTARAAEDAYVQLVDLFDYEITQRIPLLVYQSHRDFAVTNAVELPVYAEGIGGVTELFKNRIAIPFTGDWRDFRRVIHHELVHAVVNDMFYGGSLQSVLRNNIQLRIPLWFNEGLAEYAAQGWDTNSDMWVRDAVLEDYLPPIQYLGGYFAYRGGQSVFDYIAEQYGREKIGEILQRIRVSRSVDGAFRRATGLGVAELSDRWSDALRAVYFPEVAAREHLDAIGRALVTTDNGGYYNTSPAISPQGDRVAFLTAKDGLFDVYVVEARRGARPQKLIDGQTTPQFESLRILTPGLSWSPEGTHIAVAASSGPNETVALVEVATGNARHIPLDGIDAVHNVAWHPQGHWVAFTGTKGPQSDLYLLDLETEGLTNLTDDLWTEHEPAWTPDGSGLVFHSERGPHTRLKAALPDSFAIRDHAYGQYDLYLLERDSVSGTWATDLEQLTNDPIWDETSATFGPDSDDVLFISDQNGIYNLHALTRSTGQVRPVTDLAVGVTQVSAAANGTRAVVMSLKEGVPSLYLLARPFERTVGRDSLAPNVWAQRVQPKRQAPTLAIAATSTVRGNPLLRDAADGTPYDARPHEGGPVQAPTYIAQTDTAQLASSGFFYTPDASDQEAEDEDPTTGVARQDQLGAVATRNASPRDSIEVADPIDFRSYSFSAAFDEANARERDLTAQEQFTPRDHMDEDSAYVPRSYKLRFSPDLVYGNVGYDTVFGVQSVTQMLFSDVLGNHQLALATNLLVDLRNSDYLLSYRYRPRRTDWAFTGFHLARELPDFNTRRVFRYRNYGATLGASYPISKFRRVDASMAVLGVQLTDLTDLGARSRTRTFLYPSVTFTHDTTVPGFLFPSSGRRYAVSLAGSPGLSVTFATLLADARQYVGFGFGYGFAFRLSGGLSVGPNPQRFYAAGVQNWVNPQFNRIPIEDEDDFVFGTPVLPLRGYGFNEGNGPDGGSGDRFALANAEFRFPLFAAILPGPLPVFPLYNIQGVGFVDAGAISNNGYSAFRTNADGERVFDDLLMGTGFGLRTIFLGYPIRVDWAWPYDGQRFGDRTLYFSIGLDF